MSKSIKLNTNTINLSKKSINKLKKNPEYVQNQKQIECITKVLIEHADVPPKLINWLIESVKENATLEYKLIKLQNYNKV